MLLEEELSFPCQVLDDDSAWPSSELLGEGQGIVLFNCRGISYPILMDKLERKVFGSLDNCRPLFFNLDPEYPIERDAMACGLWGILYDGDSFELQVRGIRAVMNGEMWLPRKILSSYFQELRDNQHPEVSSKKLLLSKRELEVLQLIAGGASNEEIAEHLFISGHTVKSHLYRIYQKIEVPNRLQAALWSVKYL